ncbi:type 2 lanthipeptide synthetase LanM [Yersinia enterocolitica]|uniref:type 2 lanthipeptide synthetase LanM n=1 Tax=Yersinia enterocolitica TaxID=630 RepID=UPI001C8E7DEE|nr:type 2 lanthipeptide synthetase LanM [Yersinia enterocolitica]EKN4180862.1 type 2 lantipeptide synthetase LanM [Yersinia enterocolitica]MBX9489231.1 type 2 lantipeptide synthetase LanM [Yersinia enterocolitica]MBX9494292.1 type 2 lantipeptide synthetase LanM [Yersinia enterocolitica]
MKKILGINIDQLELNNSNHTNEQDISFLAFLERLAKKTPPFKKGDDIFKIFSNEIESLVRNDIGFFLRKYKRYIFNFDELTSDLARNTVVKLPITVKSLCLLATRILQTSSTPSLNIVELNERYPLLFKISYMHVQHAIIITSTFIDRFNKDYKLIGEKFTTRKMKIKKLITNLGDLHSIGNGVVFCELEDGGIIYKTRSANNESIVNNIIDYLKEFDGGDDFFIGIPSFIDMDNYSWHQHIKFNNSRSVDDVIMYYKNIGSAIAFFYSIAGVDLHYENIICDNSRPYFIDLECLFSGPVKYNFFSDSILSTCIIPTLSGTPVDRYICGIGIRDIGIGHAYDKTLKLDDMLKVRFYSTPKEIPNYYNRPLLQELSISPKFIDEEVMKGFKCMKKRIHKHNKKITNILKNSEILKGRILLRSTKFYNDIISAASHPRYTTVPLFRELFIACALSQDEIPEDLIKIELSYLKNCLIPAFYTDLINKKIYSSNLDEAMFDRRFFDLQDLIKHKDCFILKHNNAGFHERLLTLSLKTLHDDRTSMSNDFVKKFKDSSNKKFSLNNAISFMTSDVVKYKNKDVVLNLIRSEHGEINTITKMDSSLYYGYGGTLFLEIFAHVLNPTNNSGERINSIYQLCKKNNKSEINTTYGCFQTNGSFLYLDYLLYKYLEDDVYSNSFIKKINLIIGTLRNEHKINVDFLNGIAGVLVVCCRMYNLFQSKELFVIIGYLSRLILEKSKFDDEKLVYWGKKMTGFAHGNSGIVYALALANNTLQENNILKIIKLGINFENQYKIDSGWRDLRYMNNSIDYNSWCHGAPGVYLSRKAIKDECFFSDSELHDLIDNDINHFSQTLELRKENTDLSLCHGVFGNAIISEADIIFDIAYDGEKSLMTGCAGGVYANIMLKYKSKNLPNILLLN